MTGIADFSPTDALNTAISGESLVGNTANMGRMEETLQAIIGAIGRWTSSDTIASAATTDIGAQEEAYLTVSGTTTITAFGTVRTGTVRYLRFSGALTLTHNATSLILPGAANITTAAGDTAIFVSEGSGNWSCLAYQRATGSLLPAIGTAGQSLRVNSGATALEYQTGWETVAQGAFSAAGALDLTGASAYTRLRISVFFTPSADGVAVTFRTRTGGSVDTGASDYDYLRMFAQAGAVGTNTSAGAGAVPLTLSNVGNAANEAMHVTINLEQFNKSSYMWATFTSSETASDGTRAIVNGEFRRLSTTGRDGFSIAPGSGTITGNYMVEGMRG